MASTYDEGFVEGVSAYVTVCGNHPDCLGCPISNAIEGDISCEDFVRSNPREAAVLIKQDLGKAHSYFAEYRLRFPKSQLSVNELAESACRKIIFDGDTSCTGGDCALCWKEEYKSETN